jgi:hypothetical protein
MAPAQIKRMGGGLGINIEGLEELGADLEKLGHNGLREAIRRSLKGDGGEALASQMRQRSPRRTGGLIAGIGIHEGARSRGPKDSVEVGYLGELSGGHNGGGRNQLGAWIESGTKPHEIRAKDGGSLKFNGGQFEVVQHPGIRGRKIAAKSIRAAEWEVLADIVDQIDHMIGGDAA